MHLIIIIIIIELWCGVVIWLVVPLLFACFSSLREASKRTDPASAGCFFFFVQR
jgi:hypothetical protein